MNNLFASKPGLRLFAIGIASACIAIFSLIIFAILMCQILMSINATPFMWGLFWVYMFGGVALQVLILAIRRESEALTDEAKAAIKALDKN